MLTHGATTFLTLTTLTGAAPAPVVDHTVEAPVGGAEICVAEECLPELEGVRNVQLLATYEGMSPDAPEIDSTDAPGCTANVDVAFRLRWAGAGPGTLRLLVEFDRTDRNGALVPGSHTTLERDLLLPAGAPYEKDPLLSLCGTLLDG